MSNYGSDSARLRPSPLRAPASPWQRRLAHEKLIHGVRALAAFADRPYHERLTPAHVAGGDHLGVGALVGEHVGLDVAALVELEAERLDHAFVHGMHEPHGEQDEVGRDVELAAGNRLDLAIDAGGTSTHEIVAFDPTRLALLADLPFQGRYAATLVPRYLT
jgi:hypothetical protein